MNPDAPEVVELERTAAWRLRLLDADPTDHASAAAARSLQALANDLRHASYASLWTELTAICSWLAESDAISDYAELAAGYRAKVGLSRTPANGSEYILDLLAIARSLV
jgi:hypothetical protein